MNCNKMKVLMFRMVLAKQSLQRNISNLTKLSSCPVLSSNIVKICHKYCSSDTQNATKYLEEFSEEFDTESRVYDNIDLEAITDNDPEKINILNALITKLEMKSQKGLPLPKHLSTQHWREILKLPSLTQKMNYLKYMAIKEARKEEQRLLKLEKRKKYEQFLEEKKKHPKTVSTTNSPVVYGLNGTSIFMRVRNSTIDKFYNYKLLEPYMNGPDIVIDCEYSSFMTPKEINSAAFQVGGAWHMNRANVHPFNIVYTNLQKGSVLYERLKLMYPPIDVDPSYLFNYTPKSFLDLYPKDKLIYLSPHAVECMETYEPDKVYIIGCMVDIAMPEPLSLAKAKKYDIRALKFPLDKYLNWKSGGKALNMDHCVKIMLDIKNGKDWKSALTKHIPPRKLESEHPEEQKDVNFLQDARAIRRMFLKNKVHELIVDKDYKK
ncbi:mitochondrial ribonuclease P protein 1 homolog [Planococcus citri]|uniref:mitochondrial ribonuclease P protein 1 homolog n=1 Tax=Planococcus citri TaxID=170843 RepID=UPI0031F96937